MQVVTREKSHANERAGLGDIDLYMALPPVPFDGRRVNVEFNVDHAARSVEPLNGVSKGGEHPLWSRARFNTPPAKCLRL